MNNLFKVNNKDAKNSFSLKVYWRGARNVRVGFIMGEIGDF